MMPTAQRSDDVNGVDVQGGQDTAAGDDRRDASRPPVLFLSQILAGERLELLPRPQLPVEVAQRPLRRSCSLVAVGAVGEAEPPGLLQVR